MTDIKFLSKLGMRGTFGLTMCDLVKEDDKIIVVTSDLLITSGLSRFKTSYPNHIYNVGIAEQNMIGVSAGLSKEGYKVFATTFANFAAMRSYEQIRLNLGYMKFPVKIIGLSSGFSMGMFGNTHYGTEDISLMRSIPNMVVMSPADCLELGKMIKATSLDDRPTYVRLVGTNNYPIVYSKDYDFTIGKAIKIIEGCDVAIFANGSTVPLSMDISYLLKEKKISASVINMHTIKPLDKVLIEEISDKFDLIVTIEEHSIIGGLGSAVSEYVVSLKKRPVVKIVGVPDRFEKAGEYSYMLDVFGLTSHKIADDIYKWKNNL